MVGNYLCRSNWIKIICKTGTIVITDLCIKIFGSNITIDDLLNQLF